MAYAGDAFTVAPLTDDVANVALFLDALHPQVMPVDGVRDVLGEEERRFRGLLRRGRPVVERRRSRGPLTDRDYHDLHETHGLPRDLVDLLEKTG